jgi:preprotein translocase subunit Sec63
MRLLGRFKSTPSQFRTQSLVVTINFASGQLTGEIISGDLAGKQLSELSSDEIKTLSKQLKENDKESYILLQAYLIRSGSTDEQFANNFKADNYTEISKAEAYEVLGISADSSQEEVIKAHKRLMQRLHPDRGGSDYLAAKINAAKDLLIK